MHRTPIQPPPEQFDLLCGVLRDVARSRRLPEDDAQEFAQWAHLTLLQRNYEVFRRFSGRSSLRTYLTVVVRRLLLDWRNKEYGKWRPSAAALRLGSTAVALERLIYRDGHPPTEAIEIVRGRVGLPSSESLRQVVDRLPVREQRRKVSTLDQLGDLSDPASTNPLELREQQARAGERRRRVAAALRRLPPEDRWLVYMRYNRGYSVKSLAQMLKVDAKPLYRRFERVMQWLGVCARTGWPSRKSGHHIREFAMGDTRDTRHGSGLTSGTPS